MLFVVSVSNFVLFSDSAYDLYEQANFRHDTPKLRSYVSDILKGLVLLDSLDVIHNDMKPVSVTIFCNNL